MKDIIEDWVTEPEDQDSRETREVYALAGLALYCAQCLEHEIVNVLALSAMLRRSLRPPKEKRKITKNISTRYGAKAFGEHSAG